MIKGEHAKAVADLTEAIRLDPTFADYLMRARAYRALGEEKKAQEDEAKALAMKNKPTRS